MTGSDTRDLGTESIFGRTASCTEARASTQSSPHPRRVAPKIIPLLRTTQCAGCRKLPLSSRLVGEGMEIYALGAILGLMLALVAICWACVNSLSQARAWRKIAEERRWNHSAVEYRQVH